jgi:hypothetical protein
VIYSTRFAWYGRAPAIKGAHAFYLIDPLEISVELQLREEAVRPSHSSSQLRFCGYRFQVLESIGPDSVWTSGWWLIASQLPASSFGFEPHTPQI